MASAVEAVDVVVVEAAIASEPVTTARTVVVVAASAAAAEAVVAVAVAVREVAASAVVAAVAAPLCHLTVAAACETQTTRHGKVSSCGGRWTIIRVHILYRRILFFARIFATELSFNDDWRIAVPAPICLASHVNE